MYLYVETWNARPEWLALSRDDRLAFIEEVKGLLGSLVSDDLQLLGCVITDEDTPLHGGHQYVAVWQASDRDEVRKIEDGTERIGWHRYFQQVNHGSANVGPEQVLGHMLEA
ncbi:MAG: DUF6616 family protein [Xanthomonadales bacterium]|nr:DUF6616 family protein [Xanthomonadales bacterium]